MSNEFLASLASALESLDADRLVDHYAHGAELEDPSSGQVVRGRSEPRDYFLEMFSGEVRYEVTSIFGNEEWAAGEWVSRGVSRQSRTPFRIRGASILQLSGGKVTRETIYYDPQAS
jgi:hypothetical protein